MNQAVVSKREFEILQLIANEYQQAEIASALYISNNTVKTHRKHLFQKLKVKTSAGLIRRAFELGLLTLTTQAA